MEKIIITNREGFPACSAEDARLLSVKNDALETELYDANAEIKRLRGVVKAYRRRLDKAYEKALKDQGSSVEPMLFYALGVMTPLAITAIVLMIV